MKRNHILFLMLALAAVSAIIYFAKDKVSFLKETSVYKAVPVATPVFIEFSTLRSIPAGNPILKELATAEIGISFLEWVQRMDTLIRNEKNIQNSLRNEPFIMALSFAGKSELVPFIIKKSESSSNRKTLENLIQAMYPEGEFSYEKRTYSGQKITSVTNAKNTKSLHYCFAEGLLMACPKAILIEQAIRQLSTQSIADDFYFSKVSRTATPQSEISLYINHQHFPDLLGNWMNNQSSERINEFGETIKSRYKSQVEKFKGYAGWSELDLKLSDNNISFSGISAADDSLNHFLSVFDGQEAVRFEADKVLPRNTSFFCTFTFSNKARFFKNLDGYFVYSDVHFQREEKIKNIESGFRTDFKSVFKNLVKDEVIVASTDISAGPENKTNYFIFHSEGKSAATEQLLKLLQNYAERKNVDVNSMMSEYSVDSETKYVIYRFPYPSFPGIWLGKPFTAAQAKYFTFYNNFVVFCNTSEGLQDYLRNMVLGSTLDKDMRYQRFKQNIENKANINVFFDVSQGFYFNKELFSADISKKISKKEDVLRKFGAINWQVVHEKDINFNNILVSFESIVRKEAKTTWQSNIGSNIYTRPQLVVNHSDPANREIIFQDNQNRLHLVTKEGRIRWSISVGDPIKSEIYQIDYLKNGKLQYLFNTKNKLYMLDRNGNNVEHFPVTFRSPATNGISVFDYDNNRNYRYFVACEDKKVVAFDQAGKVLAGWDFGQTDHVVTAPVQHFRVANKDYIVFKDKSRIYIQDRKGTSRVNLSAKFENSNNPLVLNLHGTPKIVATDVNGKVFYLYFDGKFSEKKTGNFDENHFFAIDDLNGNGVPDFVFVDGNEITVVDENGKKLFSEKFKNKIKNQPNIYSFGPKMKKIGVVDASSNLIYLFDPSGKLHDGFPLQGNSEFSIGKISQSSEQLNLVVGSEGGKLYNYGLN